MLEKGQFHEENPDVVEEESGGICQNRWTVGRRTDSSREVSARLWWGMMILIRVGDDIA
jgi:hypothetical protein